MRNSVVYIGIISRCNVPGNSSCKGRPHASLAVLSNCVQSTVTVCLKPPPPSPVSTASASSSHQARAPSDQTQQDICLSLSTSTLHVLLFIEAALNYAEHGCTEDSKRSCNRLPVHLFEIRRFVIIWMTWLQRLRKRNRVVFVFSGDRLRWKERMARGTLPK